MDYIEVAFTRRNCLVMEAMSGRILKNRSVVPARLSLLLKCKSDRMSRNLLEDMKSATCVHLVFMPQ